MKTVVRIIDRLNIGGPALHAVLTAARMDRRRFHTVLVYGDIEPGEGDMRYLIQQEPGLSAIHLPCLRRELRPAADLRALLELARILRAVRPDIVHTHKSKAGLIGRLAAAACRVPVVVHTYHGHVLSGYFGRPRAQALLWMERLLAHDQLTTRLVTISPRLHAELSGRLGIAPAERFAVVPLGLDLLPFRQAEALRGRLRAELGAGPDMRLVGIVGRLVPIKDHLTFLRGLAFLRQRLPQVRGVIVGDGECQAEIAAAVERMGLKESVHLLGWRRDLPAIYADLDVLALTSRNEGTPVAVIEALSAGLKVVATDVGGVPDVLRGGRRGRLVPPGDPMALAAALMEVLAAPRAVDAAQQDEVLAEYGIDRLCRALADLYDELLRSRPLKAPVRPSMVRRDPLPKHL